MTWLCACNPGASADPAADAGDNRIECRLARSPQFDRFCTVEYEDGEEGRILVVRKPDGGFRRLLVTRDGRGVVAADGAEPARVTIVANDTIEVEIGGDAYRLPATVSR